MKLRTLFSATITVFILVALFVFGKVTGGFFAWFLFYFFLVLGVYELLTLFSSLTGMQALRHLAVHRLNAGQHLDVRVELKHTSPWPLFWLRVEQVLPPRWRFQSSGLEQISVPLWKRKMSCAYTVRNLPRGVHILRETVIETGDLLGLVRVKKTFPHEDTVMVYPKVVPVRGWNGQSPDDDGERQSTNRRSEGSSNVIGVRDYMSGDRLNRIHWPVTARRGQLQSKEFELHVTSDFLFIPDNTEHSYPGDSQAASKFDLAMSITASLIRHAYDNHRKFGMVVPTEPHVSIPTGLNAAVLGKCMESLAAMQPSSHRELLSFLHRVGMEADRGTVFVLVSPRLDKELAGVVSRLKTQGSVQLFVPLMRERLTEVERTGYEMLQAAGAIVHLIRNSEQLSFMHKGGAAGAGISTS